MHSWKAFGARTSHGQTQTHKTHHDLDLGETHTFPLIVFCVPNHKACTQMSFCFEIGIIATLEAYNFLCKPPIGVKSVLKL
jgi:hypothetical protein